MIKKIINWKRDEWANKRFDFFIKEMNLSSGMKILDLGGSDGSYEDRFINKLKDYKIIIADMDRSALERAKAKGYETIEMDGSLQFPFQNEQFDCIFCNSVIEHVTIKKSDIWKVKNSHYFKDKSTEAQSLFASEILRCSKKYFVQTPHRNFIIESHTWFPFIAFFPRPFQINLIKLLNKFWIKKTTPDWNLLTEKEMQNYFPNATIYVNKKMGFPKEIIAIKRQKKEWIQ